ncbi:MAG: AAA family ATPase [Deltaproteobacteria bacterium]|nr:AAA family ATPase [Deltaproteobacteria bacterium]
MAETVPFPPHLWALRVDPARVTVSHDPDALPEYVDGAGDEPDLFRLLPAAPRRAFDLGILASDPWFHVFVEAPPDVDVLGAIVARARRRLEGRGAPHDIAYVHDFTAPSAPRPLVLPAGSGPVLARGVADAISGIKERIPALEADHEVRAARTQLAKELKERQKTAIGELEGLAKRLGFGIKSIAGGMQTFPILHGKPVSAEQFEILDEGTKKSLTEAEERLSSAIEEAAEKVRIGTRDLEEASRALEEKIASTLVGEAFAQVLERFADVPEVSGWLNDVCNELVASFDDLVAAATPKKPKEQQRPDQEEDGTDPEIATRLQRFVVNVFVTHVALEEDQDDPFDRVLTPESARESRASEISPALPVIYEDNPTFANLFGFLERRVRLGALVSDFTRIRAGALHKASGGVLVLRAIDVLADPLAWDRLKRVLRARAVGHEDPIGPLGLYATTLRPRPCPIQTKVVLVGTHDLYAQLLEADPDFASLFRVKVEIPPEIDRNPEGIAALDAHLVRIANRRGWGPLDRTARARALDYSCRLAEDGRKLALYLQPIEEALAFSTVIAQERAFERAGKQSHPDAAPPAMPGPRGARGRQSLVPPPPSSPSQPPPMVSAADVDAAWQERRDRTAGTERHLREMVVAGEVLVATAGEHVGVVNGLSVLTTGDVQFGHPMRITAVVSIGNEGLIDVEREASLGGSLHTKGVAILRGFLSGTFGQERPIALRAQIAFEQSYGEVEGDSASSTELYAILSAISEIPILQGIAVTGSVNQLGEVQTIGGVTAKIEGFFDLCAARGLDGRQGVLIPTSCVSHLVLRDDVAAAIQDGRFHLFGVNHVTQGIEVLTGIPAGQRDENGRFPANSVFGRVERRLIEIAERMRRAEGSSAEAAFAAAAEAAEAASET